MPALRLDHLAIAACTLDEGVAAVEMALGVTMSPGGRHAAMGTWNRLLSLGPDAYLEVIAVDPDAPPPGRPRWFDLDRFDGPPRPVNWVAACNDLDAALASAPAGMGAPMDLARGDLSWRMAVPADGRLPWDGAAPALIEWRGTQHPAAMLPHAGCRLVRLEVTHPDAPGLLAAWPDLAMPDVTITVGAVAIIAIIDAPSGRVRLNATALQSGRAGA
jgi:hypothetical protein